MELHFRTLGITLKRGNTSAVSDLLARSNTFAHNTFISLKIVHLDNFQLFKNY